jgi:hypothetical protein
MQTAFMKQDRRYTHRSVKLLLGSLFIGLFIISLI